MPFSCRRHFRSLLPALWLAVMPSVHAVVLWSDLGATLVKESGPGSDILGQALQRDDQASDVLYFKFHVEPLSDASTEEYFAGFQLYWGDEERLGVGNSLKAWAYSAYNTTESGEFNKVFGDLDLRSARPESSAPGVFLPYELPRKGIENTVVFKVQFVPGAEDLVTAWLNPDLAPGASESSQAEELVTRFRANCSFDQIRLRHGGGGGGWTFSEIEVATSFEDIVSGPGTAAGYPGKTGELNIRFWQREQGLPQTSAHALIQSRQGYLWIGHDEGVSRFDGIRFVSFGVREGLHIGRAQVLVEDTQGRLWIGTQDEGLALLENGRFRTFGLKEGLPSRNITALSVDSDKILWAGTDTGLFFVSGDRVQSSTHTLPKGPVSFIYRDPHNTLWVGITGSGIFRRTETGFVLFGDTLVNDLLRDAHCLLSDRGGRLWIGAGDDFLLCLDDKEWRRYRIPRHLSRPYISALVETPAGDIWAGSVSEGLFRFRDGKLDSFNAASGLSDNFVEALTVDREGNVWVGTSSGLNRLSPRSYSVMANKEGLGYGPVHGLAEVSKGTVWAVRSGDGLYRWDGRAFNQVLSPSGTRYRDLTSLLALQDGSCIAGGPRGLDLFEDPSNRQPPTPRVLVTNHHVLAIYQDARGTVWAGTRQGAVLKSSPSGFQEETTLAQQAPVTAIAHDGKGALLVGTEGRGLMLHNSKGSMRFDARNGLMSDSVRCLYVDARGVIWVGTAGGGLVRIQDGKLAAFTTREGLPDDTINIILADNSERLWLGTSRGIATVDKSALEKVASRHALMLYPELHTRVDGLPSDQCMGGFSPAGLKSSDNTLWFPTQKGVAVFDPSQGTGHAPPVLMVIEQVLLNGVPALPDPQGTFKVPPALKTIEFQYTGLGLGAPERVRFRYRLLGLDEGWTEAGTRRNAFYAHVPPGKYTFEVNACNRQGHWNQNSTTVAFTVTPHLWQSWWFIGAAAVLSLLLVASVVRIAEKQRSQKRLTQLEQERLVERERARIAQDLHDDLGSSLTRISLLGDLLKEERNNPAQVASHAAKISQSAANTVRSLEEIVWALRPGSDTLQSLIEYVVHFANELFLNTPVACRVDLPAELPSQPLPPDIRHNLFLILKEALTNTIKHSSATEVVVRARMQQQRLELEVRDNGRGYDAEAAKLRGRNGLSNMTKRAEVAGANLVIRSEPGKGTSVAIDIHLPSAGI